MTLENLLKTRQLEPHETNAKQVGKQLNAICRSLEDARQETITAETRLEAAYRAIMQLSILATAGNLLFQGDADGEFVAFDATTGQRLWSRDVQTGVVAPPVSFQATPHEGLVGIRLL